jgi:hypothetical protein
VASGATPATATSRATPPDPCRGAGRPTARRRASPVIRRNVRGQAYDEIRTGVLPFFAMMLVLIVLLMLFPQIAVWLPTTMMGR